MYPALNAVALGVVVVAAMPTPGGMSSYMVDSWTRAELVEKHWYSCYSSRFHKRAQYCERKRETLVANNLIAGIMRNGHRHRPANCTMRSQTEIQARCLTQACLQ